MMRGTIVIITALMALIFLKKKQYSHHWASLASIFIGVFMVGLSSLIYKPEGNSDSTSALGIILVIVA
jgi:drug/metabolite transporter (DMT)-like permease